MYVQVESLYTMREPFCLSAEQQGVLATVRNVSSYVVSMATLKVLGAIVSQPLMAVVGLLSDIAKCLNFALARNHLTLYMGMLAQIKVLYFGPSTDQKNKKDSALQLELFVLLSNFISIRLLHLV